MIDLIDFYIGRIEKRLNHRTGHYTAVIWQCWRVVRTELRGWPEDQNLRAEIDLLIEAVDQYKERKAQKEK